MTAERMNEIFKGVQELREFVNTGGLNNMKIARQNGKTTRVWLFVQNVEMLMIAMQREETCFNCANLGNAQICNDCVLSYHESKFTRFDTQCVSCGVGGTVGKELIRHTNEQGEHEILCFKCHNHKHRKPYLYYEEGGGE